MIAPRRGVRISGGPPGPGLNSTLIVMNPASQAKAGSTSRQTGANSGSD
jgi:hypothetical protein